MTLFVPAYNPVTRASLRAAHAALRETTPGYDIFLIAGQSNTYSGEPGAGETTPDATLDSTDADILQVGRFDGQNNTIILAEEPLDHIGYLGSRPPSDKIGWGLAFAKMYKAQGHLASGRDIVLVPVGEGGSGFGDNKWNKGNTNYNDAIARVNVALAAGGGTNTLKGILWHQGEDDSGTSTLATAHGTKFLQMIDDFRTDLGEANLPFVAGGLLPASLPFLSFQTVNNNISGIVTARNYTGYANPSSPTVLTANGTGNASNNHFSVSSMRGTAQDFSDYITLGMAGRYWVAYLAALTNT